MLGDGPEASLSTVCKHFSTTTKQKRHGVRYLDTFLRREMQSMPLFEIKLFKKNTYLSIEFPMFEILPVDGFPRLVVDIFVCV